MLMGLWLWRVNIPSTHWCFFLADLDGASQVKDLFIKKGLRSLKTLFIRRQQVFYLRCKASERYKRHRTVASKTRPRAGHKI